MLDFICGHTKENKIINLNDEYRENLLPKKETFSTVFKDKGELTKEQLIDIRVLKE